MLEDSGGPGWAAAGTAGGAGAGVRQGLCGTLNAMPKPGNKALYWRLQMYHRWWFYRRYSSRRRRRRSGSGARRAFGVRELRQVDALHVPVTGPA